MRFRGNIILQYSIATFLIILAVSVALGVMLAARITDYQLRSHIRLYPELISLIAKDNPEIYDMFQTPSGGFVSPGTEAVLRGLFGLGTIFRVKAWSANATIVWSDSPQEIGQKFPGDPPLMEALGTGRAAYFSCTLRSSRFSSALTSARSGSTMSATGSWGSSASTCPPRW